MKWNHYAHFSHKIIHKVESTELYFDILELYLSLPYWDCLVQRYIPIHSLKFPPSGSLTYQHCPWHAREGQGSISFGGVDQLGEDSQAFRLFGGNWMGTNGLQGFTKVIISPGIVARCFWEKWFKWLRCCNIQNELRIDPDQNRSGGIFSLRIEVSL